ncbi:MAG: hypothetical protein JXB10_14175 [Pirellulales bacterium]|nr:hypothetical protein [Pirellulales bacterium]
MDKLQVVTVFLKKYLFWILISAAVVVGLLSYWMATGSLATEFQTQKTKVDQQFAEVNSKLTADALPNDEYIRKVKAKQDELKDKVFRAWDALYREQKEKNLWPKELGDEFLKEIRKLGPEEEIPQKYRFWYWNRIKEYFPELTKIIDRYRPKEKSPEAAAEGGVENAPRGGIAYVPRPRGGPQYGLGPAAYGNAPAEEMEGVVDWKEEDYNRLLAKYTSWTSIPSSKAVRLAQEDLWVIKSVLEVIRKTNGDVKEHLTAPIKGIEALQIGADAIPAWETANQAVFQGGASAEGPGGTMPPRPGYQSEGPEGMAMQGPQGAAAGTNPDQLLLFNRYVDTKGIPLAPGAAPPYAEFNMIPLCMRLSMDQRSITKLLVECANSAMPIEVRRVRLQPDTGHPISLDSSPAGAAGPSVAGPSAYPRGPGGGYGRYAMPRAPMREGPQLTPNNLGGETSGPETSDLVVEIQGIIYIYNPPDQKKLGTGAASEQPAEGAVPPAAAPADAATPPPAPAETP